MKKRTLILLWVAILLFTACSNSKNVGVHTPFYKEKPNAVSSNLEYSYVEFGEYPQSEVTDVNSEIENVKYDENGEAFVGKNKFKRVSRDGKYVYYYFEPIKWKIIDVDKDEVVMITDKVIDCVAFNEEGGEEIWKNSSVRKYLNESFYEDAFNEKEKKALLTSEVKNYSSDFGYPLTEETCPERVYEKTLDNVYITSQYELDTYFFNCSYTTKDGKNRYDISAASDFLCAESSDYALDIFNQYLPESYTDIGEKAKTCHWMLRTNVEGTECVVYVDQYGVIDNQENTIEGNITNRTSDKLGVRPKIKVKKSALKINLMT